MPDEVDLDAAAALRQSEAWLAGVLSTMAEGLLIFDPAGRCTFANAAAVALLGIPLEQLIGASDDAVLAHPAPVRGMRRSRALHTVARVRDTGRPLFDQELMIAGLDGRRTMLALNAVPRWQPDGSLAGVIVTFRDISERAALTEQLRRQAFTDSLTGLANRALFMDRLDHALTVVARRQAEVAVLVVDLDGFKTVNTRFGYRAGDEILVAVGRRLAGCLRPGDTLARGGGDELFVLLDDVGDPTNPARVAERFLDALRAPIPIHGHMVVQPASIGIALAPADHDYEDASDLLRDAEIAMYRAKAAGKNQAMIADPELDAQVRVRLALENDLRGAVEHGELVLHFQPEVDLTTGAVVGVEALVRWRHPSRGLVAPLDFVPVAEESGLIMPIGRWVLREACRQLHILRAQLPADRPFVMSVNLSGRELAQPSLVSEVIQILAETDTAPADLRLEVTESMLIGDLVVAAARLRALAGVGVQLAIDDFGTGYSSLSYLRHLPVDVIKIDRAFVADLPHQATTWAIVQAISQLSEALGITVTAEGVETIAQLRSVQTLRCQRAQGYVFARPMPPESLIPPLQHGFAAVMARASG
jgi:diguanylate cyclase (GGDEF)-like protein/PAS domain S-box-containing protein